MNLTCQTFRKSLCLFLCLIFCLGMLAACKKSVDPLAKSGINSVTLDKKERICIEVTLDTRALEEHSGETVSLYELKPGETVASLASKEPLDSKKADHSLSFRVPLSDGDGTRLYSSFTVLFEDGTALSSTGSYIENPALLAESTAQFGWGSSPKALRPDSVEAALELGVMHAVYDVRLSELTNGSDTLEFNGSSYAFSEACLTALDKQVTEASDAGMQVSLRLIPDLIPARDTSAALIDHLAARYTGRVSAFVIDTAEGFVADDAVYWCRMSALSLRSRMSDARVYVSAPTASLIDTKAYFSDVMLGIYAGGKLNWGAMLTPSTEDGMMSPSDLSELSDFLLKNSTHGHASRLGVTLPAFDADDDELQAVKLAYAYRLSLSAGAGLILYPSHMDEESGLCDSFGIPRRAADLFASIDTGLSSADEALCQSVLGNNWSNLKTPTQHSRRLLWGISNVGTDGMSRSTVLDFSSGDTQGFTGIRTMEAPTVRESASWGKQVLYAWLDPSSSRVGGVRKILPEASALSGASSLTVHLLTQAKLTDTCTVILTMEGMTADGTRLSYSSDVSIVNGEWQAVTFQIGAFTADLDTARPCVISVKVSPDSDTEEPYVLWVKGIDARVPETAPSPLQPLLLILLAAVLSFGAFFAIYALTAKRRSARRHR